MKASLFIVSMIELGIQAVHPLPGQSVVSTYNGEWENVHCVNNLLKGPRCKKKHFLAHFIAFFALIPKILVFFFFLQKFTIPL